MAEAAMAWWAGACCLPGAGFTMGGRGAGSGTPTRGSWGTDSPTGGQGGGQPVATRAWGGGRRAVVAKLVETAPWEAQDL